MNTVTRRTFVGATVLTALALAAIFGGKVPGVGSGSGESTVAASPKPVTSTTAVTPPSAAVVRETAATSTVPPTAAVPATAETPAEPVPAEVLEVRIEQHNYYVPSPVAGKFRRVSIDEVVKLALNTAGNDDGVRVRILRRPSARVVAWSTLHDRLQQAGLKRDAIRMPNELLE